MKKDLLSLFDLQPEDFEELFRRAARMKKERQRGRLRTPLKGKTLAMIFEKASTRTRLSFEVAMEELGGFAISLESGTMQLGRGESYADTARVLSGYVHGILIRTFGHNRAEELGRAASVPVINGLTDLYHPCQVLADLFTIREVRRSFGKICYVGDGNNMTNTWIQAALVLDLTLAIATPAGYEPEGALLEKIGLARSGRITLTRDPLEAVKGAGVVNTDAWFSMGQEEDSAKRKALRPYQVNRELLKVANPDALVLHCLPAHRGEEITSDVMDGPQSRVWQQAENRLHVQKAILEVLLGPR